jgi:LacI family transcriptional regulator, galactose operon repressor
MIDGTPSSGTPRTLGHLRALTEAGRSNGSAIVRHGGWIREGGAVAMAELLDDTPAPDGVFCANDLMAIGALDTTRARGLRVPEDIAIAGFDDIDAAAIVTPPLTSVVNPAFETGRVAGALLMARMTGAYAGPQRAVTLPCRLIARASA